MNFVNCTPFPAMAFEGIDQGGQAFHVFVLRQTLSFASGVLDYADVQSPLCDADVFFGEPNVSSVRQESDLCHYKPQCDVIVNATAYAPPGGPRQKFGVRLTVTRGRDRGTDERLIDKALIVTGERKFKRKPWPTRLLHALIRCSTFGFVRPNPWKLSAAAFIRTLPLRYEHAYGGECRIDASDPCSRNLRKNERITPEQLAAHPDRDADPALQPVLHAACPQNLCGKGFIDPAYAKATGHHAFAPPQIERVDAPLTAKQLWWSVCGKLAYDHATRLRALAPAGFGVRAKLDPSRTALCGTVDDAFIDSDDALPSDFNFAYWNAAPVDQQTAFLNGAETIELVNLCAPDTPGATGDSNGDIVLRLILLPHECFVLCRQQDGQIFAQALVVDTVLLEPEERMLTLVWRVVLPKDGAAPLRSCEARMRSHEQRDRAQGASAVEFSGVALHAAFENPDADSVVE